MRMACLALILIAQVLCMDEADEIYQLVNGEFVSHDQDLLMDIFSMDEPFNANNAIESVHLKGTHNREQYDHELNALDDYEIKLNSRL